MNKIWRSISRKLVDVVCDDEERERLYAMEKESKRHDLGFGYDVFGAEIESAFFGYMVVRFLYDHYFRVDSYGHENIPGEGPVIFASNHSGVVPIDGAMIPIDLVRNTDPPRSCRAVIEKMFTKVPFASFVMSRLGQVVGLKRNFAQLLKTGQMVLVFPEGARGMGKTFRKRYQLTRFNVGHVELSIENKAPLVPVAVIGGEEQAPIIYNAEWFGKNILGVNAFPITLTWPLLGPIGLMPLPTKYYIYYGEPFRFWEEDPEAIQKAEVIRDMADRVQASVQGMLDKGLEARPSVFFRA